MDFVTAILIAILQNIWQCSGATIDQQLEHIEARRLENLGYSYGSPGYRRFLSFNPGHSSSDVILGAPSYPSQLPEAEPILPGHTLIRPALGMLKSSVKFPHKDWDNGAGVYGNYNSLGISYGGTNERVLYTGFRRSGDGIEEPSSDRKSLILLLVGSSQEDEVNENLLTREGKKKLRKSNKKKSYYKKGRSDEEKEILPYIILASDENDASNKTKTHHKKKKHKGKKKSSKSKKKKHKSKKKKPLVFLSGAYKIDSDKLNNKIVKLKKQALPQLGYDGYSKILRTIRRYESLSSSEDPENQSTDVDIQDINPPVVKEPHPKLTWFLASQDLYDHIKINQDAPEWTEIMPVAPKDNDEQAWSFYPKG